MNLFGKSHKLYGAWGEGLPIAYYLFFAFAENKKSLSSEKDKDYNLITVFITTVSSFRQMRSV